MARKKGGKAVPMKTLQCFFPKSKATAAPSTSAKSPSASIKRSRKITVTTTTTITTDTETTIETSTTTRETTALSDSNGNITEGDISAMLDERDDDPISTSSSESESDDENNMNLFNLYKAAKRKRKKLNQVKEYKLNPKMNSNCLNTILKRQLSGKMPQYSHQQLIRATLLNLNPYPIIIKQVHNYGQNNFIDTSNVWLENYNQNRLNRQYDEISTATTMSFDNDGVLLATGSSNGFVYIYDYDEYLLKLTQYKNKQSADRLLMPVINISTNKDKIKSIQWCKSNQSYLACSFGQLNQIYIYDLEKFHTKPTSKLYEANDCFSYSCLKFLNSKLISGSSNGVVKLWDFRMSKSQSSLKFARTPLWNINVSRSNSYSRSNSIVSLQVQNEHVIYAGTASGFVASWDIRKTSTPIFGCSPTPSIHQILRLCDLVGSNVRNDVKNRFTSKAITSLEFNPSNPCQLVFQLSSGFVGAIHTPTSQLTHLYHPSIMNSEIEKINNDEDVVPVVHYAINNNSCFMNHNSIYCCGVPGKNDLNLIDFSPTSFISKVSKYSSSAIRKRAKNRRFGDQNSPMAFVRNPRSGEAIQNLLLNQNVDKVHIPLTSRIELPFKPVCMTTHPVTDALILGAENSHDLYVYGRGSYQA